VRPWRGRYWGVKFSLQHCVPKLIGEGWHEGYRDRRPVIDGEVPRCLLFHTRATARRWCDVRNATWAAYPVGHVCRPWRVQPVRVVESVTPIRKVATHG
jgi:hypothetical protein